MIVGILASNVLCFIPDQTGLALLGLPMPFYEFSVSLFVYQSESVDAVAVLESVLALILALQPMSATSGNVVILYIPCDGNFWGFRILPWPRTRCEGLRSPGRRSPMPRRVQLRLVESHYRIEASQSE